MSRALEVLETELAAVEQVAHKPRNLRTPADCFADSLRRRLEELPRSQTIPPQGRSLVQRLFLWFCKSKECLPPELYDQLTNITNDSTLGGVRVFGGLDTETDDDVDEDDSYGGSLTRLRSAARGSFSMGYLASRHNDRPERPRTAVKVPLINGVCRQAKSVNTRPLSGLITHGTDRSASRRNKQRSQSAPSARTHGVITLKVDNVQKKPDSRLSAHSTHRYRDASRSDVPRHPGAGWVPPRFAALAQQSRPMSTKPLPKRPTEVDEERGVVAKDTSLRRYTVHLTKKDPWLRASRPVSALARMDIPPRRRTMQSAVTPQSQAEGDCHRSPKKSPPTLLFPPHDDTHLPGPLRLLRKSPYVATTEPTLAEVSTEEASSDTEVEAVMTPTAPPSGGVAPSKQPALTVQCFPLPGDDWIGAAPPQPRRPPPPPPTRMPPVIVTRPREEAPLLRPETPVDLTTFSMQLLELVQKGGLALAEQALGEMLLSADELQEMSLLLATALEQVNRHTETA